MRLAPFCRLVAFTSRLQFLRFCESNTILVSKIRHSDLLQTGCQKCGSNFVISDTTIGYMQYQVLLYRLASCADILSPLTIT